MIDSAVEINTRKTDGSSYSKPKCVHEMESKVINKTLKTNLQV